MEVCGAVGMVRTRLRALHMLSKFSTIEVHPFLEKLSCSSGWPWASYVNEADAEALGLQTTPPSAPSPKSVIGI